MAFGKPKLGHDSRDDHDAHYERAPRTRLYRPVIRGQVRQGAENRHPQRRNARGRQGNIVPMHQGPLADSFLHLLYQQAAIRGPGVARPGFDTRR